MSALIRCLFLIYNRAAVLSSHLEIMKNNLGLIATRTFCTDESRLLFVRGERCMPLVRSDLFKCTINER